MALTLVTGPPGTGKSYYAVRKIAAAASEGKMVATNVVLTEGWAWELARRSLLVWRGGRQAVVQRARDIERRVFVSGDLQELFALRPAPCGSCGGCKAGRSCRKEGRALMVLDEAHEWLNARAWDTDMSGAKLGRDEAMKARLAVVQFFALHRKLGYDVQLISQSEKRLDNQVRDNFEYHTKLKNMRKYRALGFIPLFPFHWFIAITFWHASGGERVGVETYLMSKIADLYDTMARAESMTISEALTIPLPLTSAEVRERAEGTWRAPWQREPGEPDGRTDAQRSERPPAGSPPPSPEPSPHDAPPPPWVVE